MLAFHTRLSGIYGEITLVNFKIRGRSPNLMLSGKNRGNFVMGLGIKYYINCKQP